MGVVLHEAEAARIFITAIQTSIVTDIQALNPAEKIPSNNDFTPENGCLEDDPFLLGYGLFSGAFAVSSREAISRRKRPSHVKNDIKSPMFIYTWSDFIHPTIGFFCQSSIYLFLGSSVHLLCKSSLQMWRSFLKKNRLQRNR